MQRLGYFNSNGDVIEELTRLQCNADVLALGVEVL